MFSLGKPSQSSIQSGLATAKSLPLSYGIPLNTRCGPDELRVPVGFAIDHTRSQIGYGPEAFEAAKSALRQWHHFDLGWVQVANPDAEIQVGEIVAVEAHTLGLWSLNLSRILYVIDEPNRFGFAYGTTPMHVERGEERFLLEYDSASGIVFYDLLAISQPGHWMARIAYPYTRSRQRKFAHGSHKHLRKLVAEASSTTNPFPRQLIP